LGQRAKAVEIKNHDALTLDLNEALLAHPPQRAIDMDNREAEMIGDLLLRQRQGEGGLVNQSLSIQPTVYIEQQCGQTSAGIEATDDCRQSVHPRPRLGQPRYNADERRRVAQQFAKRSKAQRLGPDLSGRDDLIICPAGYGIIHAGDIAWH